MLFGMLFGMLQRLFLTTKNGGKKKAVNNADGKYILHRGEEKKRYKKLVVGLKEKDHAL